MTRPGTHRKFTASRMRGRKRMVSACYRRGPAVQPLSRPSPRGRGSKGTQVLVSDYLARGNKKTEGKPFGEGGEQTFFC